MKLHHTLSIFGFLCVTALSQPLFAVADDFAFTSIRQLGMGGAGVAMVNDVNALYTNPAGLAKSKTHVYVPLSFNIGLSQSIFDKNGAFQDAINASTTEARLNKLGQLAPMDISINPGMGSFVGVTAPGFAAAGFAGSNIRIKLINPTTPSLEFSGFADVSPMIGMAQTFSLFDTPVNVGVSGRYIYRARIIDPATKSPTLSKGVSNLLSGSGNVLNSASSVGITGFGADVGMTMPLGPGQLGVVLNNVGSTLTGTVTSGNVSLGEYSETLPMTATVGYAQSYDASNWPWVGSLVGRFAVAADYKMAKNDMFQNLYMGVEKSLVEDVLTARIGLNQGYPCFGVGLDLWMFHMQYAFTTQEKGDFLGADPVSYHLLEMNMYF